MAVITEYGSFGYCGLSILFFTHEVTLAISALTAAVINASLCFLKSAFSASNDLISYINSFEMKLVEVGISLLFMDECVADAFISNLSVLFGIVFSTTVYPAYLSALIIEDGAPLGTS